jgi:subtilisin family serine protease
MGKPALLICAAVLVALMSAARQGEVARAARPGDAGAALAPEARATMQSLAPGEMMTVIVVLREQADLSAVGVAPEREDRLTRVVTTLQRTADAAQRPLVAALGDARAAGRAGQVVRFWIFNGLAVTATADVIEELAARPDVLRIAPNVTITAPAPLPAFSAQSPLTATEPNITLINTPALWALGFRGQGIVIASMDTGVDGTHPDLAAQWRGGANSWFDPYGEHPVTPTDLNGHGTWTMGVMVGREGSGSAIGVAPQAQWIAVKIFDDLNTATAVAIHQGFQWLLDPDGNPATPDAPHVVNNSWGFQAPGCDLAFQADLQALQAAGILPIFSAGNLGPAASTGTSPANYPEAFAVGATDNNDVLWANSSRGPSACGEAQTIFPEIVAPGVGILTTERFGLYSTQTGTSLAAPHVAGALALLLNADPNLTVAEQRAALFGAAIDLGSPGPDNDYGYGRLDVLQAYESLLLYHAYLPLIAAGSLPSP